MIQKNVSWKTLLIIFFLIPSIGAAIGCRYDIGACTSNTSLASR